MIIPDINIGRVQNTLFGLLEKVHIVVSMNVQSNVPGLSESIIISTYVPPLNFQWGCSVGINWEPLMDIVANIVNNIAD